jgi:hypothetical protein
MSTWSLPPRRPGRQTRRLSRYLIAVTIGCAFLVGAGQVSPASAKPPAPPKKSCKLKGDERLPHGKTTWSKGNQYLCNDGTLEPIANA